MAEVGKINPLIARDCQATEFSSSFPEPSQVQLRDRWET